MPPPLDAFIRTMHSQTPIPQAAHQNGVPQHPADPVFPRPLASYPQGPPPRGETTKAKNEFRLLAPIPSPPLSPS